MSIKIVKVDESNVGAGEVIYMVKRGCKVDDVKLVPHFITSITFDYEDRELETVEVLTGKTHSFDRFEYNEEFDFVKL